MCFTSTFRACSTLILPPGLLWLSPGNVYSGLPSCFLGAVGRSLVNSTPQRPSLAETFLDKRRSWNTLLILTAWISDGDCKDNVSYSGKQWSPNLPKYEPWEAKAYRSIRHRKVVTLFMTISSNFKNQR